MNKRQHDGDCSFYAAVHSGWPADGICTCGYGKQWSQLTGELNQLISNERMAIYRGDNPISPADEEALMNFFGKIEEAPLAFFDSETEEKI